MNPFMTWVAENLGAVLVAGLLIGVVMFVVGALATWRTATRLRTPPRPFVRFSLSLIVLLAGAVSLFSSGLAEIGPGIWAQRGMLGKAAPELEFALVDMDAARTRRRMMTIRGPGMTFPKNTGMMLSNIRPPVSELIIDGVSGGMNILVVEPTK